MLTKAKKNNIQQEVSPLILPLGSSGGYHVAVTAVPFPLSGFTWKFSGDPEGTAEL